MKIQTVILIGIVMGLLCPPAPAQTASLDEMFATLAKWDFDQGREPQAAVWEAMKAANSPAQRRDLENRFIALLKSDAATPGAKDFACKQLSVIGSDASVPVLAAMLASPKSAEIARYALERIPGPAVDRALRSALAKTSDRTRIGIINTLGRRRDGAAVSALRPLASGSDQATAAAALFALAEIADRPSLEGLAAAQNGSLRATAAEAYLKAADRLAERGNGPGALTIYKQLYAAGEPHQVRVGALRGVVLVGGAQSTPVLMEALRASDAGLQAVAIRALARTSANQLAAAIPNMNEAAQIRILGVLAEQGNRSALPTFTAALRSSSKPVRIAALTGMGWVGDPSTVPVLAGIAAGDDDAEQTAARESLGRMPGKDVDQALVNDIAGAEPKARLELIRAAGERGTAAAGPVLLKMAHDSDADVRRESLRALREVGSSGDISELAALVAKPVNGDDRAEAARSLSAVLRRSDPSRIQDVLSAATQANDMETRAAFMQVLGGSGNPQSLPVLRAALKDPDAGVKRAAILALGEWPDASVVPDLLETARAASLPAHQVLALRGALRLIGLPAPARPHQESVKLLAEAYSLAKQADEKRAVLALLPRYPTREGLELAKTAINDSEVASEAQAAVNRLQRMLRR